MNLSNPFPEFVPVIGQNVFGYASTSDGLLPCRVDYNDELTGFLFLSHGTKHYRVYRTDFKPMPQINSRFRQYVFDSVAHIWAEVFKNHPSLTIVNPSPLSVDTFAKKLRDSRVAKNKYGWKHVLVNEETWNALANQMTISIKEDTVEIGIPGSTRNGSPVGSTMTSTEISVTIKNSVEIEALCRLIHERCFGEPRPVFSILGITAEQVDSLEQRYDVAFVLVDETINKWQII